jgi:hypothetical protein
MTKRDQKPTAPPVVLTGEQVEAMNARTLRKLVQSGKAIIDPAFVELLSRRSASAIREDMRELRRKRALKLIRHQLR